MLAKCVFLAPSFSIPILPKWGSFWWKTILVLKENPWQLCYILKSESMPFQNKDTQTILSTSTAELALISPSYPQIQLRKTELLGDGIKAPPSSPTNGQPRHSPTPVTMQTSITYRHDECTRERKWAACKMHRQQLRALPARQQGLPNTPPQLWPHRAWKCLAGDCPTPKLNSSNKLEGSIVTWALRGKRATTFQLEKQDCESTTGQTNPKEWHPLNMHNVALLSSDPSVCKLGEARAYTASILPRMYPDESVHPASPVSPSPATSPA